MRGSTKIGQQKRIITWSHFRESFATILYLMKLFAKRNYSFSYDVWHCSGNLVDWKSCKLTSKQAHIRGTSTARYSFRSKFPMVDDSIFFCVITYTHSHGEHNQIELRCNGSADKWIMEKVARDSSAWKQPMRTKRLPLIRLLFLVFFLSN